MTEFFDTVFEPIRYEGPDSRRRGCRPLSDSAPPCRRELDTDLLPDVALKFS
jgi:hypothetical protein